MKKLHHIIFVIFLFCNTIRAHGQYSYYGNINPSATIQTVMVMSLTNNSSNALTFANSTQYSNGYSIPQFYSVAIKTNVAWNLYISATTANFGASGTYSSANMPASVITLTVSGKTAGIQLATASQLLSSGSRGDNSNPGNSFNIDFNANPGYNYGPGIYTLTINYTLSAQ